RPCSRRGRSHAVDLAPELDPVDGRRPVSPRRPFPGADLGGTAPCPGAYSKTAPKGRFARGIRGRWFAKVIGLTAPVPVPLKGEKKGRLGRRPFSQVRVRLRRFVPVDVLVDAAGMRAVVAAEHGDRIALLVGGSGRGAALHDVRVVCVRIPDGFARVDT